MATYSLTFGELETAASDMSRISSQISNFLQELQTGTMQSIMEWESVARDEFDSQRSIWAQAAADMTTQAANAQAALQNIITEYQNGENVGIKIWNR
jgi:WXG100 family type VII secretion target